MPRVVHAYEPHEYADEVEVVGAGMAAATEWLNALAAGASVVSVRRREPVRRPLNLPRPLFTRRGLASFHGTARDERVGLLRAYSAPSYPPGRDWDEPLRTPRFRVAAELNGAAQIICATGFRRGFAENPVLARLVSEHGLETADRWIVLAPDSTVPALTDETRTLALAGVHAQWAFPAADTLVGAKYAARGLLRQGGAMSYTLRGRLESRLAPVLFTLALAVALAAVERAWWPLQLAALMAVIGVALDVLVYDRVLEYQPGWLALPLGALELGLVMLAARLLGIDAPLAPAVALFAAGWLAAQVLGHAVLPLARLTYAQDGGELGRAGPVVAAAVVALFAGAAGTAYAHAPAGRASRGRRPRRAARHRPARDARRRAGRGRARRHHCSR